jgi:predicted dehydrogenase
MSTLGVALVGLDHWYAALSLAGAAQSAEGCRLVAVAHHDEARARQVARDHGAEVATTDYRAVLARGDVDIVVAMYSTEQNVDVCRAAAAAGKHIVGVKPMAMDLAGADAIVEAVRAAGVTYLPFEALHRLAPRYQQIKRWIDEGRIGRPQRYSQSLHTGLPQEWPGAQASGWWVDPARVPGGGWLDHAIYAVDLARWLFGGAPSAVQGLVANRRHADLPVEDYGLATYTLSSGVVAVIEDTWTAERGFFFNRSEIVGSAGAILDETQTTGRIVLRGDFGFDSWTALEQQRPVSGSLLDHMVACVRGAAAPIATAEDGRANLAACVAFYQAARGGSSVPIGS